MGCFQLLCNKLPEGNYLDPSKFVNITSLAVGFMGTPSIVRWVINQLRTDPCKYG